MPMTDLDTTFERVYRLVSNPGFLSAKGFGNDVPFFIQPYDIQYQDDVYRRVESLAQRLAADGTEPLLISLYDVAMDKFSGSGRLEKLFAREPELAKGSLKKHMSEMTNPKNVIVPSIRKMLDAAEPRIVLMYQVGEVFPFLRTHEVLSNLQSVIETIPLIVFFPGQYVSSNRDGFYLSLFGKFKGDYYRAFHLEDYLERRRIDGDA